MNQDLRGYVKELIALRKAHPALRGEGIYQKLHATDGVYIFKRASESEKIVVAFNAADSARSVELNEHAGEIKTLFGQADFKVEKDALHLNLPHRSSLVLKI